MDDMDSAQLANVISSQGDVVAICSDDGTLLEVLSEGNRALYGNLAARMRATPLGSLFGTELLFRINLARHTHTLVTYQCHDEATDQWFLVRISPLPFPVDGKDAQMLAVINNTMTQRQNERLKKLSLVDSLTGLYNRRMMDVVLTPLVLHALANGSTVCAVIFDIDHFKAVNDTYGHITGDRMLKHAGEWGHAIFPDMDIVRFGGDEFVLFAIDRPVDEVVRRTEELREHVASSQFHAGGKTLQVTVSAGIGVSGTHTSYYELFHLADKALYQAKNLGRNRVQMIEDT
jgi:diguanylate cyclase (GGDEF)-like protein